MPVAGSTILISMCGITWPTVPQRCSSVSSSAVCVDTGEVSVIPNAIAISSIPMSLATRFITSIGQGEPAMIPVRSELRSKLGEVAGARAGR